MSSSFDFASLANLFRSSSPPDFESVRAPDFTQQTLRSSTVFSGDPDEWVTYLNTPWAERRNHPLFMDIELEPSSGKVRFHARNEASARWEKRWNRGFALVSSRLAKHKKAREVYRELLFGNESNFANDLHLHATSPLPSEATREIRFNQSYQPEETDIVLRVEMLEAVEQALGDHEDSLSDDQFLGRLWPVLRRIISQLGYPSYPRDRFKDRIELTTRVSFITLQLLFDGKHKGRIKANEAGDLYLEYVSRRDDIPKKYLYLRHPYIRMLNDLSFLLKEKNYEPFGDVSRVVVRDFLDQRYLRISIAGVMPGLMEWMAPMDVDWVKKKKVSTPSPQRGLYGILDNDDLSAWKKLAPPLKEIGFVFTRQLGIGQFGRVYEAVNLKSGKIPERVAIKVDRIRKSKKEEAIQAVDTIMDIGNGLCQCPHVIRIYDAGRLKPINSTYHVLQLVDGDTLDNLIGVTGTEHASIYRPPVERTNIQDLRREYLRSIKSSHGEKWRSERVSKPFTSPLGLSQAFDVMTSTLLWLEECHGLGYAINDLKNGNLMLSRRGQLKGIDLDTYSPIRTPLDKLPDFFFLAVTVLLFALRVLTEGEYAHIKASGLLGDITALHDMLTRVWRFGDISKLTKGRLESEQVIQWLIHIIEQSRDGTFAHEPETFSAAIDDLIRFKRAFANEEMVLD
jgi:hypothetical protein